METNKKKKPSKKVLVILAVILAVGVAGAVLLPRVSGGQSGGSVNELAAALSGSGTDTVEINKNVTTDEILYVNGDKTLTGSGKISMSGDGEYIIVVNEGATLTIDGPVLDGAGVAENGIYVSGKGALVLKSGSVINMSGHGIRVLGTADIEGGTVKDVGTNWLMVDENAEAKVSGGSFSGAGENGIITAAGSKLTVGGDAVLSDAAGSLIYNGGDAVINGGSYTKCKSYAIHNDGTMSVTDTDFKGAESLGYLENAAGAELSVTGGSMTESKADFVYNMGKAVISKVSFDNCSSSAIESKGAEASLEMKDCSFENIGRNVLTNHLSTVNMENITVGDCGGYVVNNSGAEFTGKNITVENCGATAFLNDAEAKVCKNFSLDTFSIGSAKEYGIRNNGAAMTLSNGTVGKTDDYSLYVKAGEVTTNNVRFAGITNGDRAVIQIGQSSTPTGQLTMNDTDVTGGARGVSNHGTFIFNSGAIHDNKSKGDLNYGAGVNNTGTMEVNGGEISFNTASESGGGIYNSGKLTINGWVTIKYNYANNNGGGIGNKGTLNMKTGYVFGNAATKYGGGIYNTGSAAMYWGTVEHNRAGSGGGGFVNSGSASLNGGYVKNNTTTSNGAGVYTMSKGTTTMNGVTVTGNVAGTDEEPTNGGGLYNLGVTTVKGKTSITDNTSTKNGSGIYNTSDATLKMQGGTVTGTPADGYALYIYRGDSGDGKVLISDAPEIESIYKSANGVITVAGNVSTSTDIYMANYRVGTQVLTESKSGLIAANKDKFDLPEMDETKVIDNSGKIAMSEDAEVVAEYAGITFTSIQEAYNLLLEDGGTGTIKLIADNTVSDSVEFAEGTNVTLDLNGFNITQTGSNRVLMVKGICTLTGSGTISGGKPDGYGGGIYVNGGTLYMKGGTISDCSCGQSGAGIYVTGAGAAFISGGSITNCTATGNGGAIGAANGSVVSISGGTFSGCTAGGNGGAINIASSSTVNISGGSFSGCTSSKNGGAVYVTGGGTLNMTGGTMTDCTDSKSRALFVNDGTANISGGTMINSISRTTATGTVSISGGWFGSKVSNNYKASGYTSTDAMADAPDPAAPYTVVPSAAEYTVKFVTNNDSTIEPLTGTYDNQVVLPTPTPADEYTDFAGWYTDESFNGTAYDAGTKAYFTAAETTMYAKWAVLPDVATVTVGETTTGYKTFASAIAATDGQTCTLTLLEDAAVSATQNINGDTNLTLNLNGHNVTMSGSASVFKVFGNLTLTGSGTVSGGSAENGAGVYVSGGTFNMYGGTISGCTASKNGGAVYIVGSGVFNLGGGNITGCSAGSNGGALYVAGSSTFNMSGGTISGCTTPGSATAYFVYNGKANISGGTVIGTVSRNTTNGKVYSSGGWFEKAPGSNYRASGYIATGVCADAPNPAAPYTVVATGTNYTVSFTSEYGTAPETATVACGTDLTLAAPAYDGTDFVFDHWEDASGNTYAAGSTVQAASALELTAVWTAA